MSNIPLGFEGIKKLGVGTTYTSHTDFCNTLPSFGISSGNLETRN